MPLAMPLAMLLCHPFNELQRQMLFFKLLSTDFFVVRCIDKQRAASRWPSYLGYNLAEGMLEDTD